MASLSSGIWDRSSAYGAANTMSKNLYAFMVCFWTALGVGVSAYFAHVAENWQTGWPLILGVLASSFLGIYVSMKSESPVISLFGYALIVVPFGLLLGPYVALYTSASVFKALLLTTVMVVSLGFIGATIPDSLESWGSWLFGGLIALLGGLFLVPVAGYFGLPVGGAMTALDWVGLVLFGGLVIYDLNRAMRLPFTMDNAIDSAVAVYLDVLNIFIRILELTGQKKD
jgi:FtsH-binding integral membrane protein